MGLWSPPGSGTCGWLGLNVIRLLGDPLGILLGIGVVSAFAQMVYMTMEPIVVARAGGSEAMGAPGDWLGHGGAAMVSMPALLARTLLALHPGLKEADPDRTRRKPCLSKSCPGGTGSSTAW